MDVTSPSPSVDAPAPEVLTLRLATPEPGERLANTRRQPWFATKWQVLVLACILAGGTFIRVQRLGTLRESFDAALYEHYVQYLVGVGTWNYPDIVEYYIDAQRKMQGAILPPTRFLYIFSGYLWHEATGNDALTSLRNVSCLTSVLMLFLCAVFIWRMAGLRSSLGVTALMATAPVQIHMGEHALIDGFFAFWAMLVLWSLWECLRSPDHAGWQTLYAASGALLVLTKENAFFVFVGVVGLLVLNGKLRFGTVTPRLLLLTITGPLLGVVLLLFAAGGVENMVQVYRLLVSKAYTLNYAIQTGDGPWHRYLVDLLLVSPLTLLLAVGAVFRLRLANKPALYLCGFVGLTYVIMCNVKYGMNLRYSTIWDLPLRYLAFSQLITCSWRIGGRRYAPLVLVGGVGLLCAYDLHQRQVFFVENHFVELISENLLRAVKILKIPGNE